MSTLHDGELINQRYRILSRLGSGGMGQVYLGRDLLAGDRQVALKTVEAAADRPEHVDALRREFSALTQLRHPNLAQVYDFGQVAGSGTPFFTMDYVEGGDLVTAARGLPGRDVCEWIAQVCRALGYLHARGFLHRDLKPANILVTRASAAPSVVKLVDFGLLLGGTGAGAAEGAAAGTAEYTAPEVFLGKPAGRAADLYSLGVVLYELLCGTVPFRGGTVESVARQHVHDTPEYRPGPDPALSGALWPVIQRLLAKDPQDRWAEAADVIVAINLCVGLELAAETRDSLDGYFARSPLVGRGAELARLREVVDALPGSQNPPRVVLLEGRAGLGKTRLLQELRHHCQLQGVSFFEGSCPRASRPAYGPLHDVLRLALAAAGVDASACGNDFAGLCALAATYAEVRPPSRQADMDPAQRNVQFADILLAFLTRLGDARPCVIALDDIHWADSATAELVTYVVRNGGSGRFCVIVAYRGDELGADAGRQLVDELSDEPVARIALGALSADDMAELTRRTLGELEAPSGFSARFHQDTGGNPFFALELLRLLAAEGSLAREASRWRVSEAVLTRASPVPTSLSELVGRRVQALATDLQPVLTALAVIGEPAAPELLAEALGAAPGQLAPWLAELTALGVVGVDAISGDVQLAHPEVGRVLYAGIPAPVRQACHARVGDFLERRGRSQAGTDTVRLATHFLSAGDVTRGWAYGLAAAEQLQAAFANAEALRLYDQVLALGPAVDAASEIRLCEGLAEVHRFSGETAKAVEWCQRGLSACVGLAAQAAAFRLRRTMGRLRDAMGDFEAAQREFDAALGLLAPADMPGEEAARLYDAMAQLAIRRNDTDHALELCRAALSVLGGMGPEALEASVCTNMAVAYQKRQENEEALRYFARGMAIRQQIGDQEGLSRSLNNKGMIHRARGEHDLALQCYRRSLVIKLRLGNLPGAAVTHYNIGNLCAQSGDCTQAGREYEQSLRLREKSGDRPGMVTALLAVAYARRETGDYDRARAALDRALALQRESGRPSAAALIGLAELWLELGALDQAEAAWREAASLAGDRAGLYEEATLRVLQARLEAERTLWEQAAATVALACSSCERLGQAELVCAATVLAAEVALARGQTGVAEGLLLKAERTAQHLGGAAARAVVLRLGAEVCQRRGETERALAGYEEAVRLAEAARRPETVWRAAVAAAEIHASKGRCAAELSYGERMLDALRSTCVHIADHEARIQYMQSGGRPRVLRFLSSLAGRLEQLLTERPA